MASVQTNDRKRAIMADAVMRLKSMGWTAKQLAALMYVQPGTVATWARGESMGTNAQRQRLRELRSVEEERPHMRALAANCRHEAELSDRAALSASMVGAHHVENNHTRRAARLRARADFLDTI